MSETNESTQSNPTNDVFLCAICGQLHPSGTIFCEHTGRVILPAEMIPFDDAIECPFCGNPHQKELHYCPETGRLMPILDSPTLETTQPIPSEMPSLQDAREELALAEEAVEAAMEAAAADTAATARTPMTKTVVPTQRYGKSAPSNKNKGVPASTAVPTRAVRNRKSTAAPSQTTPSEEAVTAPASSYLKEEIARYRTNQSMMMIVIGVLLVALIVGGFFLVQLSNEVNTLQTTVTGLQTLVTDLTAQLQILGQ